MGPFLYHLPILRIHAAAFPLSSHLHNYLTQNSLSSYKNQSHVYHKFKKTPPPLAKKNPLFLYSQGQQSVVATRWLCENCLVQTKEQHQCFMHGYQHVVNRRWTLCLVEWNKMCLWNNMPLAWIIWGQRVDASIGENSPEMLALQTIHVLSGSCTQHLSEVLGEVAGIQVDRPKTVSPPTPNYSAGHNMLKEN